jgi:hypothetical protein
MSKGNANGAFVIGEDSFIATKEIEKRDLTSRVMYLLIFERSTITMLTPKLHGDARVRSRGRKNLYDSISEPYCPFNSPEASPRVPPNQRYYATKGDLHH